VELLEKFSLIGMVTGMPMWTPREFSTSTIEWAKKEPDVHLEIGKFLSWEDYWRHAKSLGAVEREARTHFDRIEDVTVELQGRRYFVGAAHFQFVARKTALEKVLPIPSQRPMGQVRLLDIALNEQGFLRFCTPHWYVQHMGNTLQSEFASQSVKVENDNKPVSSLFWELKPVRKVVNWLYHQTFEILYRD
jgi:hypothetical protein